MPKIIYLRDSFDSRAGRIRSVLGYEARALIALGYAEYYREEEPAAKPEEAKKTHKRKARKNAQLATPKTEKTGI